MLKRPATFLLLACITLALMALASAEDISTDFRVVLKNENGEPVGGAEVYVLQLGPKAVDAAGPFHTNAEGAAHIKGLPRRPTFDQFIYARVPGKLVGAGQRHHWPDESTPAGDPFMVTMFESRELRGRVSVPDGFKVQDVTVRLLGFVAEDDERDPPDGPTLYYMEQSRDWLPQIFQCRPNADGTFVLSDTPARSMRYIGATARGLGEEQWSDRAVKTGEALAEPSLEMHEEAVIEGSAHFDGPESKPATGLVVTARTYDHVEISREFTAVVDKDGRFRIAGLTGHGNKFELVCKSCPEGWTSAGITGLHTNAGTVTGGVGVKIERGSLIHGRVLDTDGNGVAGAHVTATNPPHGPAIGTAKSAADGSFTLRVPAGISQLHFSGYPENYGALSDDDPGEKTISADDGADQEGVVMRVRKVAPSNASGEAPNRGL
jgi:hypothetical protein